MRTENSFVGLHILFSALHSSSEKPTQCDFGRPGSSLNMIKFRMAVREFPEGKKLIAEMQNALSSPEHEKHDHWTHRVNEWLSEVQVDLKQGIRDFVAITNHLFNETWSSSLRKNHLHPAYKRWLAVHKGCSTSPTSVVQQAELGAMSTSSNLQTFCGTTLDLDLNSDNESEKALATTNSESIASSGISHLSEWDAMNMSSDMQMAIGNLDLDSNSANESENTFAPIDAASMTTNSIASIAPSATKSIISSGFNRHIFDDANFATSSHESHGSNLLEDGDGSTSSERKFGFTCFTGTEFTLTVSEICFNKGDLDEDGMKMACGD